MLENNLALRASENFSTRFSYFGDRTYIDVTTINSQILPVLPVNELSELQFYKVRIQKKIERNGRIIVVEGEPDPELLSRSNVFFRYILNNKSFSGFIFPDAELISERVPEPQYDLERHLFFSTSNCVHLIQPFNKDLVYNLMKLGKAVILRAGYGLEPRVGEFRFDYVPHPREFDHLKMRIKPSFMPNIFILQCFVGSNYFGRVFVTSNVELSENGRRA